MIWVQKKIGILTMFYNSRNYGGCLQAYALEKYLINKGAIAEQVNLQKSRSKNNLKRYVALSPAVILEKLTRKIKLVLSKNYASDFKIEYVNERSEAFKKFRDNYVKSSDEVYSSENIKNCIDNYDTFVVGSDQVWNEVTEDSPYLLGFVPENKEKVSYAASISQEKLSSYAKKVFKESLSSFKAISVRESDAVTLLRDATSKKVIHTLDPTLLLSREEWDSICESRKIDDGYIFCYFLGTDKKMREVAQYFAKKHNLKIVTLPYLQNRSNKVDGNFGDIKLWDVSPCDFLSLIKYAKFVFTDSFHSTVFSYIYNKQFVTFSRTEGKTNSRMVNLLELLDLTDRFIADERNYNADFIDSLSEIDYSGSFAEFEKSRKISENFISENILS